MKVYLSLLALPLVMLMLMIPSVVYGQEESKEISTNTTTDSETTTTVDLLNHKIKTDELSEKLIGQVQNNLDEEISFVKIIATFYDETGSMVGTQSTYTDPENLPPQMKVPFEIYLEDDASTITSYDVIISWETDSGSGINTVEGLQ